MKNLIIKLLKPLKYFWKQNKKCFEETLIIILISLLIMLYFYFLSLLHNYF